MDASHISAPHRKGALQDPGASPPDMPKVSIITVVYNGAATLERTIESVLAQGYPDLEYIIVDGGSTDGTVDIIKRHGKALSRWVSEPDQGIYDAMNKGIAMATGQWIGMINADDAYAEGAVERAMVAARQNDDTNIIHGDILIHYANGARKVKHARRSGFLLKYWEMVLNHPSFFVRRSYYANHPYDAAFRVGGDHLWTLSAWREDPGQFHYVPEVLAHFTAGGASMQIPLRKVLAESDAMAEALGFSWWERLMARAVRTALYLPAMVKLWSNQLVGAAKS